MRLTEIKKGEIYFLHKAGDSNIEISKKLNINRHTVDLWINRFKNTGTMDKIKVTTRITNKLTLKQLFQIIEIVDKKECDCETIINALKLNISESTLRNILKATKHRYGEHTIKPLLTDKQKFLRVDWCKFYKMLNWFIVEFSDEMTVWKNKNNRKCWYKIGNNKVNYKNSHSIKYNVWGMINSDGEFYYSIFSENMNCEFYENILYSNLIPLHKENNYFQQDNNSSHRTKNIKEFFEDFNINILPWPSNSPDLNLIENVWHIIKNRMSKIRDLTNENFKDRLIECLNSVTKESIVELYNSMNNRINEVIINGGNTINY